MIIGLVTFLPELRGKHVRVWEDNAGGEGGLWKGSSAATDQNLQVHAVWLLAARNNFSLYIARVASAENIADEPSRHKYDSLERMGAVWRSPTLPSQLWRPESWADMEISY